jgi:hypothetical protein
LFYAWYKQIMLFTAALTVIGMAFAQTPLPINGVAITWISQRSSWAGWHIGSINKHDTS